MNKIATCFHFLSRKVCMFMGVSCVLLPAYSQINPNLTLEETIDLGLPVVVIETIDAEEPTCDYIPTENGGGTIANETKVPGRVIINHKGDTIFDSGEYIASEKGMTIKIRGNITAFANQKPYKIKLQKKADMLCRGDDKYKDKNWLLLKPQVLKFLLGFKVNELMGLQWTPATQYVNLFFNGEFRGLYMLVEAVERNTSCRLNVDKTGYIIESDGYWWAEDVVFWTDWRYLAYSFKYPDPDDITEEQIDYIKSFVNEAEGVLYANGTYEDYFDVPSIAAWLMGHDILGTADYGGANIFVTKYDNTPESKLTMGNLWDFDSVMLRENEWSGQHENSQTAFYFPKLFNNENQAFVNAYYEKWDEIKSTVFQEMQDFITAFESSDEGVALANSLLYQSAKWGDTYISLIDAAQQAREWFSKRELWMTEQINAERGTTNLKFLIEELHPSDDLEAFDVYGRRVSHPHSGLYIMNNKIILKK